MSEEEDKYRWDILPYRDYIRIHAIPSSQIEDAESLDSEVQGRPFVPWDELIPGGDFSDEMKGTPPRTPSPVAQPIVEDPTDFKYTSYAGRYGEELPRDVQWLGPDTLGAITYSTMRAHSRGFRGYFYTPPDANRRAEPLFDYVPPTDRTDPRWTNFEANDYIERPALALGRMTRHMRNPDFSQQEAEYKAHHLVDTVPLEQFESNLRFALQVAQVREENEAREARMREQQEKETAIRSGRERLSDWRLPRLEELDDGLPMEERMQTILSSIPDEFTTNPQALSPEQRTDILTFLFETAGENGYIVSRDQSTGKYQLS